MLQALSVIHFLLWKTSATKMTWFIDLSPKKARDGHSPFKTSRCTRDLNHGAHCNMLPPKATECLLEQAADSLSRQMFSTHDMPRPSFQFEWNVFPVYNARVGGNIQKLFKDPCNHRYFISISIHLYPTIQAKDICTTLCNVTFWPCIAKHVCETVQYCYDDARNRWGVSHLREQNSLSEKVVVELVAMNILVPFNNTLGSNQFIVSNRRELSQWQK